MDTITNTLLSRLSLYLNFRTDWITPDMVADLRRDADISEEEACCLLLAAALEIDPCGDAENRALYRALRQSLRLLDPAPYLADAYCRELRFPEVQGKSWAFSRGRYAPYEVFVRDDFQAVSGRILPSLGCFAEGFAYPRVLQNGLEWMSVTPNEVNTMRRALTETRGRVLTYGLGMGYYLFHALKKPEVESVTVVERDAELLSLFREALLPQFPRKEAISLIEADAFDFAAKEMGKSGFDTVFTDLWHDAGDGLPLYRRMRSLEHHSPRSRFLYWIEATMKAYEEN